MQLRSLVALVAPPLCAGCGASAGSAEPLCSDCRRRLRWLCAGEPALGVPIWAALAYEGGARALVRALKFRGAAGVAAAMGAQLAATVPDELLDDGAALVPVPLHPARRRRRGFNQAELLARVLGRRRGCKVADCLERTGPRATQMGRSRHERLADIGATVRVRAGARVPGSALLVDDVVTTGATMSACAAALCATGTEWIAGIAYARTLGR